MLLWCFDEKQSQIKNDGNGAYNRSSCVVEFKSELFYYSVCLSESQSRCSWPLGALDRVGD